MTLLVLRGGFRRVEHVLLALSAVFVAYVVAGSSRAPTGARRRGAGGPVACRSRATRCWPPTAAVGTTLAPWGLAFIQSYAVDKRLTSPTSATSGST